MSKCKRSGVVYVNIFQAMQKFFYIRIKRTRILRQKLKNSQVSEKEEPDLNKISNLNNRMLLLIVLISAFSKLIA